MLAPATAEVGVNKLVALESIRGIAALLIVAYHTAYQPPRPFPAAADPWLAPWGMYSLPMFFVLSAFVLWYGYIGSDGRIRGGALQFYRRRFLRIAPLFYLLAAVHLLFVYDFAHVRHLVLSSLTFVFNLIPGQRVGFVMAGWSIGVEVLYYAMLPLVALLVRRWWVALPLFVGSAVLAAHAGRDIVGLRRMAEFRQWDMAKWDAYTSFAFNALFFAAGILAVMAFGQVSKMQPDVQRRIGRLVLRGSVVALAVLGWAGANAPFANRWAWAVALGALVFGLATAPPRFMEHPAVRWAGARSYSIYLVHAVVIWSLIESGFIDHADRSLGWGGYVVSALAAIGLTLAISAVTYRFVEVPGMRLGGSSAVADRGKQEARVG